MVEEEEEEEDMAVDMVEDMEEEEDIKSKSLILQFLEIYNINSVTFKSIPQNKLSLLHTINNYIINLYQKTHPLPL